MDRNSRIFKQFVIAGSIAGITFLEYTFDRFGANAEVYLLKIVSLTTGIASQVSQVGSAASSTSVSIGGLFVKLFLVPAIFCAITAVVGLWHLRQWKRTNIRQSDRLVIVIGGVAALVAFFGLMYVIGFLQPFRYLTAVFVVIATVGAIAIRRVIDWTSARGFDARPAASIILVGLLLLSASSAHAAGHIFIPTHHATEATTTGYETSFEHWDGDPSFSDIRSTASRYKHMIYGTESSRLLNVSGVPYKLPRYSRVPDHSRIIH